MTLLLAEILERLKQEDEITILELLNINSEMLVDRFPDLVENMQERIEGELEE